MKLRGIEFGNVFNASGALNFFGQGWNYHHIFKPLFGKRFSFNGSTFNAKTSTVCGRYGNMPLKRNLQPKEIAPRCVKVYPFKKMILNAVGLSGPGWEALLESGELQKLIDNFVISVMAIGKTYNIRMKELELFVEMLLYYLPEFKAKIVIENNITCPNVKHNLSVLLREKSAQLIILARLHTPIILKVNALTPIEVIRGVWLKGEADAICCSNTIPWEQLPDKINWKKLFGSSVSPLADMGGGGLSGEPLLPIVADWIKCVRDSGIDIPIIGGGGILKKEDVKTLKDAGANAVFIGSVAILRPWRVQGIIQYANQLYSE
jgi:dihydroorotate dehydrogenase